MSRAQLTSTVEQSSGGAVAPFLAGKNKIINGDFGIWQRGTSFAPGGYNTDRWQYNDTGGSTVTISRQAFDYSASPAADKLPITGYPSTYFYRATVTVAAAYQAVSQKIEDVRTLAGQTATVSFWAKADSTKVIGIYIDQDFGTGGSATVTPLSTVATLSTSWTRYSFAVALPSISGKTIGTNNNLTFRFTIGAGTFDFWGVQVEAGSVATPFTTATGTLSGELAACQRYYATSIGDAAFYATGSSYSWTEIFLPVTQRVSATIASLGVGTNINVAVASAPAYLGSNCYRYAISAAGTGQVARNESFSFSAEL